MTTKDAKTVFFAAIIGAMILPFSSIGMADAITQDDNKNQKKIDKLEAKLQKIEQKITKVQNKITELEERLENAKAKGNDTRVQNLEEKIDKKCYSSQN